MLRVDGMDRANAKEQKGNKVCVGLRLEGEQWGVDFGLLTTWFPLFDPSTDRPLGAGVNMIMHDSAFNLHVIL